MKKKIRIGILTESFLEWSGGVEFLRYVVLGLSRNQSYELQLFIPDRNTNINRIKNIIKGALNTIVRTKFILHKYPNVKDTAKYLCEYLKIEKYTIYGRRSQLIAVVNKKCDIVLPAFSAFDSALKIPSIGYLYDFQHKYLPDFFNKSEIVERDLHFENHVKNSDNIIVNANTLKRDIEKFHLRTQNIHVIPLTPPYNIDFLQSPPDFEKVKIKYQLGNKPYFIICNQFWKHKGHLTAIEALKITLKEYNIDCNLICTGLFPDHRNMEYCQSIKDFVDQNGLADYAKFVGFVEKSEQLSLLLNCKAVIQPTQFEGGPGGFSVFEALAFYQRSIISDIDVNKELDGNSLITFFRVNDSADLAEKMVQHINMDAVEIIPKQIQNEFESKRIVLENFWSDLINKSINKK